MQAEKIRPPRFVSFNLELEPYNYKKAYALDRLNDINLKVFEAETIQKVFEIRENVLIITGKRLICVQEHREGRKRLYKHWNVYFADVVKLSFELYDRRTKKIISGAELNRYGEDTGHLRLKLKVIYQLRDRPENN